MMLNSISARLNNYGVPHGSNLWPHFVIYYDIALVCPTLFFILFADDTNTSYSHSFWQELIRVVNGELSKIAAWFAANKLTLNLGKLTLYYLNMHRKVFRVVTSIW